LPHELRDAPAISRIGTQAAMPIDWLAWLMDREKSRRNCVGTI